MYGCNPTTPPDPPKVLPQLWPIQFNYEESVGEGLGFRASGGYHKEVARRSHDGWFRVQGLRVQDSNCRV